MLPTPAVLPDTNYLIYHPRLDREPWQIRPLEIIISQTVAVELDGLSRNSDPLTAQRARQAIEELDRMQRAQPLEDTGLALRLLPRVRNVPSQLTPGTPDHQIIAQALEMLNADPPRFCAILSNDLELCDIAEAFSAPVIIYRSSERFHQELQRKHYWWTLAHSQPAPTLVEPAQAPPAPPTQTDASPTAQEPPSPQPRQKKAKPPLQRQASLDRFARQVYRRLQAEHFRAALFLPSLQARLTLGLEVLRRIRLPQKRSVLIITPTGLLARHWASELRQKGAYRPGDILLADQEGLDRPDKARALIYTHAQAARCLPLHLERLAQAGHNLTALVNGCDLLAPEILALLLYECDQFIGLNDFPFGSQLTSGVATPASPSGALVSSGRRIPPGRRMLSLVLRDHSIAHYSFADAERDGWGHPCDLHLDPIDLTREESNIWEPINSEYIQYLDRLKRRHPKLQEAPEFWEALEQLLDSDTEPDAAEILGRRERREQIALLAWGKGQHLLEQVLSSPTSPQHYRRLVFDPGHYWTRALLPKLNADGIQAAELPEDPTDQALVWSSFASGQKDLLLFSHLPDPSLPGAHFHQLILLGTQWPQNQLLEAIDWSLAHTLTLQPLSVHIFFVKGTPEETAALELAAAGFENGW